MALTAISFKSEKTFTKATSTFALNKSVYDREKEKNLDSIKE